MPNITPNPITVTPAKTSGGSLKNAANLIGYSAAAQGPQAELWANVQKAFKDAQSQLDGLANSLRAPLAIPDPIQVVDAQGNLVANIGTYVSPLTNTSFSGIWAKNFALNWDPMSNGAVGDGVADDTSALQKTLNDSGGILYLRPGKTFLVTSTISYSVAGDMLVFGGGKISSTVGAGTSVFNLTNANAVFFEVLIIGNNVGTAITYNPASAGILTLDSCSISGYVNMLVISNNAGAKIANCRLQGSTSVLNITSNAFQISVVGCDLIGPVLLTTPGTLNFRGNDILDYYSPQIPRAFIGQSASQTIGAAGFTNLSMGTGVLGYNIGSPAIWSSGSPTRFTAPVAGSYLCIGQWTGSANISTSTQLIINKNSAGTSPLVAVQQLMSTETPQQQVSAVLQLAKNDFIEYVVGNTGAATATTAAQTWGSMVLLSQP